jgi:rhodanese-related sulfurtransferase
MMDPHFDGVIFTTHAAELHRRLGFPYPPFTVLDVRPETERGQGAIPGSQGASADSLGDGLPEGTTAHTEFYVVGRDLEDDGTRKLSEKLRELGAVRVVELPGGVREWCNAGFDLA